MNHRTLFFAFCSFLALATGCSGTEVTINEQTVYTPPAIDALEGVADARLAGCINQTLVDQKVSQAEELERLVCTNAGIKDLTGIEQLESLVQLDLGHNALESIAPLRELEQLTLLRLANNPDLLCDELEQLAQARGAELEVVKPAHCS